MLAEGLEDDEDFAFQWNGFDFIASVARERALSTEERIDMALASGVYRPRPDSEQLSS
jgi:hypothetical protein